MNVPLMYNFRSLSNKFPTIFSSLIFTFHFLVRLFFVEKRKPKIFGLKNAMEREIRKCLKYYKLHLKFSGKHYSSPCNFETDSSSPRMIEQIQIL